MPPGLPYISLSISPPSLSPCVSLSPRYPLSLPPHSLFLSLSLSLSPSLFVSLPLSLCLHISHSLYPPSFSLSLSLSRSLSLSLGFYLPSLHLSLSISLTLYLSLSPSLSISPPSLSIYLSISINLSHPLSLYLFLSHPLSSSYVPVSEVGWLHDSSARLTTTQFISDNVLQSTSSRSALYLSMQPNHHSSPSPCSSLFLVCACTIPGRRSSSILESRVLVPSTSSYYTPTRLQLLFLFNHPHTLSSHRSCNSHHPVVLTHRCLYCCFSV